MNLINVLGRVNQIEKISFLKILDKYCEENRDKNPKINEILTESDNVLKKVEDSNIVQLFTLLRDDYRKHLESKIIFSNLQLDVIVEIFIRDGNQMMTKEWFTMLYKKALSSLNARIKSINEGIEKEKSDIDDEKKRDYIIYKNCVETAYCNDVEINREERISWSERTILHTLSNSLGLSGEEEKSIRYSIVPAKKQNIDDIISELKEAGIIFFNRKTNTLFIPIEIIYLLRKILHMELPSKYLRRVLKHLRDPELNLIARKYNIDKTLDRAGKINAIISQGINVTGLLTNDMHNPQTTKIEKAKRIQTLILKDLNIDLSKMGRSLEERVDILLDYLRNQEKDDTTSLSRDGLSKLVDLLVEFKPDLNQIVKEEFEVQNDNVMDVSLLGDYNIGPRDLLYLISKKELTEFCITHKINSRGNQIANIINNFRNVQDLYLENFIEIGCRDLNTLKEKGLVLKESELGLLYEKVTKDIFQKIGFSVDEKLKMNLNTARLKMDILINIGNKDVIIVECKTAKDKDYNKYTAVSRQLKSYETLCKKNGYHVNQVVIVANDFSEDFISECEYDLELSISLITSNDLIKIYEGLNESNYDELPVRLLLKDGVLSGDRIVKALNR